MNTPDALPLTTGPGFHWFGHYDKWQFDPTDRYVLGMRVDFEHRLPGPEDAVTIGMIDLAQNNRWTELGRSRAWSWQQGCMLQWRPGTTDDILFNDREDRQYVCRVLNVRTGQRRTLPQAIGTVSPCGRWELCEDFRRIWDFRAGYGYSGIPDPHAAEAAPAAIGVWRMDLNTGALDLIVSVADLTRIAYPGQAANDRHYVNHLTWNPTGERFLMFDRWPHDFSRWPGDWQPTRAFTAAADGSDLRLLSAHGASHWTWRDPEHVLIWAEGAYRLYSDDGSGNRSSPCGNIRTAISPTSRAPTTSGC